MVGFRVACYPLQVKGEPYYGGSKPHGFAEKRRTEIQKTSGSVCDRTNKLITHMSPLLTATVPPSYHRIISGCRRLTRERARQRKAKKVQGE